MNIWGISWLWLWNVNLMISEPLSYHFCLETWCWRHPSCWKMHKALKCSFGGGRSYSLRKLLVWSGRSPQNCSQLWALLKRELAQKLMSNLPQRTAELIRRRTSKHCLHKSDLFANKSCWNFLWLFFTVSEKWKEKLVRFAKSLVRACWFYEVKRHVRNG